MPEPAEFLARALFAMGALALVVWQLRSGAPLGAALVVIVATAVRRSAEAGRLRVLATRFGHTR